jgi:putative ABC transport system permease protein
MALRETRAGWRHFIFFLICISLGVGSLIGVAGFSVNLERTIQGEARSLSASDLQILSNRPLKPAENALLSDLETRGVRRLLVYEMDAMAATDGNRSQLVELKVVDQGYPYYGRLVVEPPDPLMDLLRNHGAVVQESLLIRLNVGLGDSIKIGRARFTIRGIVRKEPDRTAGAFSLGPRVFIDREGLTSAGLVQTGSRIHYRTLLRLPGDLSAMILAEELKKRFADPGIEVLSYREAQPRLTRFLERLTLYMGLAGLITLLVGGTGVAATVRTFIHQKLETIAILKCIGAGSRTILMTYLSQILFLGLVGCLIGVGLGIGISLVLPPLLSDFLPVSLDFHLYPLPILQGIAMGLLATLFFALWPLLSIRDVPPAWILRREVSLENSKRIPKRKGRVLLWVSAVGIGSGLAGIAFYQAGSMKLGAILVGAILIALLCLGMTAWGILRLLRALPKPRSLPFRQGVANILRPGNQTGAILVTLGIGGMLVFTLVLVERNLLRQIGDNVSGTVPSFFFIDIQSDQKEVFSDLLRSYDPKIEPTLLPLVRSRLDGINQKPVSALYHEDQSDAWYFTREYVLTFLQELPKGNRILRGRWWEGAGGMPEISVEKEAAAHLRVDVGSTMTFDIQGAMISAKVTSIRSVDWSGMTPNFFVIFEPGGLDPFPMSYVSAIQVARKDEVPLQQRVVNAFPNVTAIPMGEVLESVAAILRRIGLVIRFLAFFSILAGMTVLIGALVATRYQRLRESAIFKVIGATRFLIVRGFAVEYAVLGAAAGLISAALATAVDFTLMRFVMDSPWMFQPGALIIGMLSMTLITIAVGFLSTYRVLGKRPLPVLRSE